MTNVRDGQVVQLDRWSLNVTPNTNAMKNNICNCDLTTPVQTSTSLSTVNAASGAQSSNLTSSSTTLSSSSTINQNKTQNVLTSPQLTTTGKNFITFFGKFYTS